MITILWKQRQKELARVFLRLSDTEKKSPPLHTKKCVHTTKLIV